MPVPGPGANEENAEIFYQEVLQSLKAKGICYDRLCHPKMHQADMDAALKMLHQAIKDIYRIDSWDSW